jgi:hypothetical protein
MDRVRFGRALGSGARETVRALARAADAALSPDPRAAPPTAADDRTPSQNQLPPRRTANPTRADLQRSTQRFRESAFKPIAKASSVLWFEFTGSFFGLFAVALALETWKHRAELRPSVIFNGHAWLAPVMMLVFSYFTISSFVSASRRNRR